MSPVTLVIGASRGIGREIVHQLSQDPAQRVIATTRKPTSLTSEHDNIETIFLDQTDPVSIATAAANIPEIDTLIINGAIGDNERLLTTSIDRMEEYFKTNALGPLRIVQAFLSALRARQTRKIIFVSSYCGSFGIQVQTASGWGGPYSVSKAAVNMISVQLHNELEGEGFTIIPLHPGSVATDMGNIGGGAEMTVDVAVRQILDVIKGVKKEDSGRFFSYDGSILPW